MKLRRSCLSDAVIVHAGLNHFEIKPGDQVDLDQLVNGSTTLEAALGPLLAAKFEAVASSAPSLDDSGDPVPEASGTEKAPAPEPAKGRGARPK